MNRRQHRRASLAGVAVAALAAVSAAAGCSNLNSSSAGHAASAPTASTPTVSTSKCGTKPGVKATGSPIVLGGITTKEPGTDFSDIGTMAAAYFDCVNDNGGVNGHPIKYYPETEQTNPSQIASLAHQLVSTDHAVGIVGNSSIIECSVDNSYWKKEGFYVLGAGIDPECWSTAHTISVNMGPRYSSDGAVAHALKSHVSKIAFDQSNVPGTAYIAGGPNALAAAKHVPIQDFTENVPLTSANSVAIKLANAAGPNGAVILNFTPPEALLILQAAQKLGLEDKVKEWGCSTPCNTDFLAKALGPKWNHKLFVNAELTPPDGANTPEFQLYREILGKYGHNVSGGIGSFSQMGFVLAKYAVKALEGVKGPYTMKSVNHAFKGIRNYHSDMQCRPWTYGDYAFHIPNNVDYTTTPDNGQMRTAQGCTPISSADPQIAGYRKIAGH